MDATWSARSASTHGNLDKGALLHNAELGGTVPMWQWIGDDGATTFSF